MAFWQSRREGAKIARKRKQGEHKTMKSPESEKKLRYFFGVLDILQGKCYISFSTQGE